MDQHTQPHIDKAAEAIAHAAPPSCVPWESANESWRDAYRRMAEAVIAALQLTEATVWVPIAESGEEWAERSEGDAKRALSHYPPGGKFPDGDPWDGIVRIERRQRLVGPWGVS